jgi:hypothetical protein
MLTIFLTAAIPFAAYPQQSQNQAPDSQTMEGTVIGVDGTKYWSGFRIGSGGKEYTFVTKYNAGQGRNPTVVGGQCCIVGERVRVTYTGSLTRSLLNVTRVAILGGKADSDSLATPARAPASGDLLKPNQLTTFSLEPKSEKLFVLQMKKGDFAGIEALMREELNLSLQIYDSSKSELLQFSDDSDGSVWFAAPNDGEFVLVAKLGDYQYPEITAAERISLQYRNVFKLPAKTKVKGIRKINGFEIKIMTTPDSPDGPLGDSILIISKNGQMGYIKKRFGTGYSGFSFDDDPITKATIDKTGNGIPDILIDYFSGGAHCCFHSYFFDLGDRVKLAESMDTQHGGIGVEKNGKGGLRFLIADYVFAYWLTSYATSPAAVVVLEFKNGKLRPNFEQMKKPAPSLSLLKNEAEFYRQKLSLKPYRGDENFNFTDSEDPFYKEDTYPNNEDQRYKGVVYPNVVFWGPVLNLIYTGHEELAWQFLDLVWPSQKQGKALFIRDFKRQLLESSYWKMILEDRGIPTPSTASVFPVNHDIRKLIVGTWRDENSVITYRPDGTNSTKFDNGMTASGNWSVDGDNLTYIFVEVNGKPLATPQNQRYQILEISKDRYVAKGTDGKVWNGVRVR